MFFSSNISSKLDKKNSSLFFMSTNPPYQPSSSSAQSSLSEECPRGRSGSGSSPSGAQPELIVSEREQEQHVCIPVGLSAERPVLTPD